MIRTMLKIVLISILTLSFTACENKYEKKQKEEKEVKFTPKLPMPEWDELGKSKLNGYTGNWHKSKEDPIPAMKIGYAYSEKLKDYEKAIQWYKYADSMIPLGENSYFACYAYEQLKQYEEAIKWCKNSIDLKWDKAIVLLGTVYEDYTKYDKAIEFYKKSFEKTNDKIAANNLGYIYSKKIKDYKEAEKWYKEAIRLDYRNAYQNISTLYHKRLKDDIKASAYSIAVINTEYT